VALLQLDAMLADQLSRLAKPRVAVFLTGSGRPPLTAPEGPLHAVERSALEAYFVPLSLDLHRQRRLSEDVGVVVITDPEALTRRERRALRRLVRRGGSVLIFGSGGHALLQSLGLTAPAPVAGDPLLSGASDTLIAAATHPDQPRSRGLVLKDPQSFAPDTRWSAGAFSWLMSEDPEPLWISPAAEQLTPCQDYVRQHQPPPRAPHFWPVDLTQVRDVAVSLQSTEVQVTRAGWGPRFTLQGSDPALEAGRPADWSEVTARLRITEHSPHVVYPLNPQEVREAVSGFSSPQGSVSFTLERDTVTCVLGKKSQETLRFVRCEDDPFLISEGALQDLLRWQPLVDHRLHPLAPEHVAQVQVRTYGAEGLRAGADVWGGPLSGRQAQPSKRDRSYYKLINALSQAGASAEILHVLSPPAVTPVLDAVIVGPQQSWRVELSRSRSADGPRWLARSDHQQAWVAVSDAQAANMLEAIQSAMAQR